MWWKWWNLVEALCRKGFCARPIWGDVVECGGSPVDWALPRLRQYVAPGQFDFASGFVAAA
jgi:hypothetical protein